ncbi:MAG TPA: BON domain-containing protein [Steroidobacteraceae bacterium]
MAFRDLWRGGHERERRRWQGREQDDRRDFGRPNYAGDEEGFRRRGWREGSDYYGNDPERYSDRGYGLGSGSEFYGRERYRSDEDDWRDRSGSYGEFDEDRRRASFGDRSQDTYSQGLGSFGRPRYQSGDSDYGRRGREDDERRWGDDRAGHGLYQTGMGTYRGRGPRGYKRSDERIREDVCECLTEDDYIDATNIEVQVKDGEVTLSGTVNTREEKRRACDLIEDLPGVKDVHNNLRVGAGMQGTQTSATEQQQATAGTRPPPQTPQGSRH